MIQFFPSCGSFVLSPGLITSFHVPSTQQNQFLSQSCEACVVWLSPRWTNGVYRALMMSSFSSSGLDTDETKYYWLGFAAPRGVPIISELGRCERLWIALTGTLLRLANPPLSSSQIHTLLYAPVILLTIVTDEYHGRAHLPTLVRGICALVCLGDRSCVASHVRSGLMSKIEIVMFIFRPRTEIVVVSLTCTTTKLLSVKQVCQRLKLQSCLPAERMFTHRTYRSIFCTQWQCTEHSLSDLAGLFFV